MLSYSLFLSKYYAHKLFLKYTVDLTYDTLMPIFYYSKPLINIYLKSISGKKW